MFKPVIKQVIPLEKKSYLSDTLSFFMPGLAINSGELAVRKCINYYYRSSPLFTALKLISDNMKTIPFVLKDTNKDEFVYEHPLLELLKNPNPFETGDHFKESIISFYLLSGDTYINVVGSTNPVELAVLPTQFIRIVRNSKTGIIDQYDYTPNNSDAITYKRNNKNRYFAPNGNELINMRNFNPDILDQNQGGLPYIQPIKLELSQYLLASVHNDSLLQNQGRPSGILSYKGEGELSDEQIEAFKAQVKDNISGATNAGKSMFLSGNFDWKQLSESIKDMDFAKLKIQTSVAIYNALKIPLPMISPEHMSLANMDTAKLNFYDNAIIPWFDMITNFLGQHLLPRYKGSENLKLTFDEAAIAALRPRIVDNIDSLSKSGVLTVNEIRSLLGYEDIEGGDTLYQPANLIPIGEDSFTSDNRDQPARGKSYNERAEFRKSLVAQVKNSQGERVFSDEEVDEIVADNYDSIN
jgi:HK97 family phage portal protein